MSFLDYWCHFPQDDLYSPATWGTHPVIKAFTFKSQHGGGVEVLFAHLNRVQKPLWFLCSQYLCPDQSLGQGAEGKGVSPESERFFELDHDGVI